MSITETIGVAWIIFTSALGHLIILIAAYRQLQRILSLALRGEVEERRDVAAATETRLLGRMAK